MFFNDHLPPHFHARYGEFEATITIETLDVMEGEWPIRALGLVREWAIIHREEARNSRSSGSSALIPVISI
jgi:hypothetical protein